MHGMARSRDLAWRLLYLRVERFNGPRAHPLVDDDSRLAEMLSETRSGGIRRTVGRRWGPRRLERMSEEEYDAVA